MDESSDVAEITHSTVNDEKVSTRRSSIRETRALAFSPPPPPPPVPSRPSPSPPLSTRRINKPFN